MFLPVARREHVKYLHRAEHLRSFKDFPVRFVSIEPMLSPLPQIRKFLDIINWVIVGGETGRRARPLRAEWVREVRDICMEFGVPFFFKQWGGSKGKGGRLLDGKEYNQMPDTTL